MNKIQRLSISLMTLLMATSSWAYKVTINQATSPATDDPTITASRSSGAIESGTTDVLAGTTVTLTVGASDTRFLTKFTVKAFADAGDATVRRRAIQILGNIDVREVIEYQVYEFTMPNSDVTITPEFANRTSISDATVTLTDSSDPTNISTTGSMTWTYDWLPHLPMVSKVTKTTDLEAGKDYTVSSFTSVTNVEASARTITITGKGKYKDSKNVTYSITARSISDASVQFSPTSFVYNHANQAPLANTVEVYLQGQHLTLNTDYKDVTIPAAAQNKGSYDISVTGKGNFTGTASGAYTITQMPISNCTFTGNTSFVYNGNVQTPTITVYDGVGDLTKDTHYTVSYSNSSSKEVGTYTMTITAKEGTNYSGSKEITYSINSAGFAITAIADQTYTGSDIEPTIVVTDNGKKLTEDTHYTVVLSNNKNVGTAKVTVVGINSYNGNLSETTFNIVAKSLNAQTTSGTDDVTITISPISFVYNTSTQKPTVTVKDGSTTLIENKDYTLSNPGGLNVGTTYMATITGIGNYKDSKNSSTYPITVLPFDNSNTTITLGTSNYVYDGTAREPEVRQVKVNGITIPSTDYTTEWSHNTDAAESTATTAPTVTIKPKTSGTINLSGEATTTFTISPKPLTSDMITLSGTNFTNNNFTYDGNSHAPTVVVKDGDNTLTTTSHYTLTNAGGTAVGVYYVIVEGKGNYTGTIKVPYNIVSDNNETGVTITYSETPANIVYTGSPITLHLTVKKDDNTLTANTDYEFVYSNNTNVGEATITILGKGNYHFVAYEHFTILPKPLAASMVALSGVPDGGFVYTGTVQKPIVTLTDAARNATLVENVDYKLTNDGNINVGTGYTVKVEGIGNYQGKLLNTTSGMPTYTIVKRPITSAVVSLVPLADPTYSGGEKRPTVEKITVTDGSVDYVFTSGFTVAYENNVNASTTAPTVKVTGANFDGTATATFTITPKPVNSDMITLSGTGFTNNCFTYDGTSHAPTVVVKDGGNTLNITSDYTLTNTGGTAIGTYNVTITGEGNYTGTASKSYSIVVNDASGFSVSAIEDQTYDGTPKTPAPVVKEGETTLTTNYYTVAYLNNINAGTAVVTVTGKNGYNFVKSQTFTIQPKALNTDMLTLSSATFAYNGSVQKPTVTMADLNAGNPIITSNDYIVTNEGGTDVNTYTVSVTGKNNYTGTISKTFTINPLNISTATITLATLASYVYDGVGKTPAVQLVKVGELVVPSSAYDVAYSNNINVGSTATVTVTAKTGTNFTGSCSTTFSIEKRPVTADMIILSSENLVYTGSNQAPTVTVKIGGTTLAEETDYTVDIPAAKDVANYWITVTGKGNYTGNAVKQFSIVAENSAAFDVSAISPAEITFTGLPIEPTVTVWKAGDEGGTPLVLGTDYLVTYSDNLNAGTATVTVSGQGNYGGTRRVTFTIVPKAIAEDAITLSQTSYNYNGTEQRPYVTVTDGTKTLKENADYTVDYPVDTKSQGTKTLTIKGIGNYQGTWTKTYTIGTLTIANASVTLTYDNTVYNGTPQKPTVLTVYANGIQLTEGVDYTVSYPTDAEATTQGNKNIVINGAGNYSGSRTVTYQIAPKPVTTSMITLSSENLIYTGSLLKPEVTVKDGNLTMTKDTDYTLTNDGGTNYGTYNVVITGKGNYTGEAIKTYSIVRKDVSDFTVSAIADMIYDGTAKQPLPEVKDHMNKLMTRGTDFLISYSNNTNAGTATATVTGINSYSGTKSVEFIIQPKSLTVTDGTVEVTLSKTALPYTGSLQRPEVIVKDGSKTLVQNTDYTIINDGGVANGSYEVKITGIGNYKDVVTRTYTIGKISLEGATVILNRLDSYVYDGTAKTPSVSEVKVEASSISSANYTVTYTNNVNVGTATVTVTATETGNCTGSATATFAITPKTVNSEMIAFTPAVFSYDGNLHKPETVTVKDGTSEMTQDTDYTLVNEGGTALGTYSVTIIGKGNYAGSASKSFSIAANDASAFVIEGVQDVVFDGSEQKPVPVVKDGDTVLDAKYYTVAYMNNVDAGTAVVTVSGKDGYSFIKSKVFNIAPKTLTADMMSLSETNFVYNGSLQKPVVTMSDGGSLTANDYTLSNEGGINNGTYRVVATGQSNYTGTVEKTYTIGQFSLAEATVILSPLSNAIYDGNAKTPGVSEVQIGTVVVSPDNYIVSYENNTHAGTATVTVTAKEPSNCTGSITTTFTITPKTVTSEMIELSPSFLNYDGTLQKPSLVTVKDGALSMTKDTDYTLINEGGTTVGSYQVTITGKGDYTGTASKSYSIVSNDASGFSIDAIDDLTFDGTEKTPLPVVKDENGSTIPADGYSVTYLNNVNAGTAFVTVMGKNGYSFIKSQMFTIKPKQLTADMVSLSATEFIYNGSIQRPVVTITDGGTGEASLITNSDYILINDGGANIGTYQVVVNGQNNYTGTVEMTYSISLLTLSDATITLGTNSFVYDGTAKEPLVQLVNVGQVIVTSSDYSVAYSDNVNVGQAKVTITGKGNYSGSKTVYFTITPKSLTNDMVTLTPSSVVYNEKLQKPVVTVKDGQTVLVENVDYTLTNDGGTEAGNYTVYIAGIGNYGGTILATFTIEGPDMVAEIDGTNEKGYQTKGSANIRPTEEDGDEAEIVSFNDSSAPGQLPTTSITIPATSTSGGKTYTITGIADGAFANMSNLKDVFLPETESPLTIGENAFPEDVVIHVPLALLDDYALMPTLESYFKDNKVMSTVKVSNRLWTFSSGVDVAVPDNVSVYVVHERNDNSVTIIELSDEELMVGGQRIIKANNGVLFECKGFVSEYDLIASAVRMSSGTTISTDDHKDYGQKNCLEPVIESKHYESGNYYFLKNNEFYHVKSESESLKVPAGKAVLYLKQQATTRGYSHVLSIVGEDGKIEPEAENGNGMDAGDWYDMNGRKLEGVPIRKGVYIRNNQKIVIK